MRRTVSIVFLAVALAAAACGDAADTTLTTGAATASTPPAPTTAATAAPSSTTASQRIEIASEAGTIVLDAPAQRIAALSAAHVEMLYDIGAGDQIIAGDLFSDYPPETERLAKLDSFNLSVEAVIDLDPDLVVLTFDPGDAVAALDAVGIPTLLFSPAPTLAAAYDQMQALGAASGHETDAAAAVDRIAAELSELVDAVGDRAAGLTYYHETDPFSFYTPNSDSFIGQVYALLGMENIADAARDEFGSGYPQLSPEFIVESDPDVIFLGSEGETPESVAQRDAWSTMSAVAAGRVFVLDADESSRWGPRIVDFLEDVVAAIDALAEDG
jgi:iron complex transport system substrate-binding protein